MHKSELKYEKTVKVLDQMVYSNILLKTIGMILVFLSAARLILHVTRGNFQIFRDKV